MSKGEKERKKSLEKLENVDPNEPVDIVFKDGKKITGYVYDITSDHVPTLLYTDKKLSGDVYFGSKVGPSDLFPSIPLCELGYVKIQKTGQKISLMPFQKPA